MLKRISWILASTFSLIIIVPDVSSLGGAFAFAAGSGSGATAKPGKTPLTQDNHDALSAFMASPTFTRVASTVPSSVEAGPLFPLRGGLLCQRMTQTIKIDGQNVHASALMCRHPNGVWKIAVPPGTPNPTTTATRSAAPAAGPPKPDAKPKPDTKTVAAKTAAARRPAWEPAGSPVAKAD